jgi:DNA-directed RNA polymerase subunit RPC12/RpoP
MLREGKMDHIDIENGKIQFEDNWYSAEDLKQEIQDKINAGDMKFSRQAALLEELNTALESAHVLETKIVLTREQYEKLTLLGGGNDNKCVRKAVLAYIEDNDAETPEVEFVATEEKAPDKKPAAGAKKKTMTINCSKCAAPIEIDMTDMPSEIRCPSCNARGVLKTHKNKPDFQDHYMG